MAAEKIEHASAESKASLSPSQPLVEETGMGSDTKLPALLHSRFPLTRNYQALELPDLSSCGVKKDGQSNNPVIQPILGDQPVQSASSERVFRLLADSAPVQNAEQTKVEGNVRLITTSSILRAEQLDIDKVAGTTTAVGGVSVETADSWMSAEAFERNDLENQTRLEDAEFYFFGNNARGRASRIEISGEQSIMMNGLAFSTCPGDDPDWLLSAGEMNLDAGDGWGEAWNTVLRIGGVPVFYLPYINFPMNDERKSGLLMPVLSTGERNGFDYSQPIYWNIAPNYDATFTPRIIQKRGTQLGTELRFLFGETLGNVNFEWLANDKIVEDFISSAQPGTDLNGLSTSRWRLDSQLNSRIGDHWRATIDLHRVSDFDYLRDLGGGLDAANQTLISSLGKISYSDEVWDVSILAQHHQSLVGDEPYRKLPSLTSSAFYPLVNSGLIWSWYGEYSNFVHPDDDRIEGKRLIAEPALSWLYQQPWGYIKPKFSTVYSHYEQQNNLTGEVSQLSRNVPIFSLDSALFFEKNSQWSGKGLTHTLSPRLFYVNIPNRQQQDIALFDTRLPDFDFNQLWRENRFVGYDRIGDSEHVSVAIDNRWSVDETGRDLLKLTFGQKFYLKDRNVNLLNSTVADEVSSSPLLLAMEVKLQNSLNFSNFVEWDGNASQTQLSSTRIKYEPIDNHIVNLTHRYRKFSDNKQEEADLSFAWPINEDWRFMARWYRDLVENRTVETVAGLEYESCCWALRLVGRRYLNSPLDSNGQIIDDKAQFDSGLQLQFVFKGLGSAGQNGVGSLLESSIDGYQDRLRAR